MIYRGTIGGKGSNRTEEGHQALGSLKEFGGSNCIVFGSVNGNVHEALLESIEEGSAGRISCHGCN
jgi:hypothetical protein